MALKSTPIKAATQAGSPVYQKIIQPQAAGRFTRTNLGGIEPPKLASIMRTAQTGDLEDWADLCSYAVRTDPHLRSVAMTRINAVAGADIEVLPGPHGPGQEAIAEDAAAFVREAFERIEEWEDRFADLLWGSLFNVAALENRWRVEGSTVWGDFGPIMPRDLRYPRDWSLQARTYPRDDDGQPTGQAVWIRLSDYPGKFTINAPHNISERPTITGEFFAIMWPWLFKRIIEKFGLEGFGKFANGLMYSTVPTNTESALITDRLDALESLGSDGVAVFRADTSVGPPITLLEAAKDPGSTSKALLDYYNGEMSKALLGSGLNVEVGSTGGNRALGESQFATTILPRLQADAKRALGAIRRDFVRPLLGFNTHRFGGQMPPVPKIRAVLIEEKVTASAGVGITTLAVQGGVLTKDELRGMAGLDPLPEGQGGGELVALPGMGGTDESAAPFAATEPTAPVGRARIAHQPGGEWAVVDEDGKVLDVFARKADAVDALRKMLLGDDEEEGGVVHVTGGEPAIPKARRAQSPQQLALTFTQTASASRMTPLGLALSRASDDQER